MTAPARTARRYFRRRATAPGSAARPASSRPAWRALSVFLLMAVVALVAVSAGTVYISEQVARRNALAEAERSAVRTTEFLIEPVLTEAMADIPGRWEELGRRVAHRLSDDSVSAILVWTAEGEILFASDEALRGRRIAPTPELLAAVGGEVVATIDDHPETAYAEGSDGERTDGERLLEVYVPLQVGEEALAVEVYFGYDAIERQAALLRSEIIPLAVGSLLILQLVQVPIAVSLVRRVRRQEVERADLLARSFSASERERRAIAGDVHDGPVQDLAGVSYALSALRPSVPADRQATVDRLVTTVRDAVRALRRLIVDIYPPDLSGAGLALALDDLVGPVRSDDRSVRLETAPVDDLEPHVAAVVYRTAKEALANVVRHAEAHTVVVRLGPDVLAGRAAVRLEVTDDGTGLRDDAVAEAPVQGHVGLRLMRDRVTEAGGTLTIRPGPEGGTSIVAVVPAHRHT